VKVPCPSLVKALNEADWERLLPRLTAYAEWRLRCVGWAHGRDEEPNRISAMEAIDLAVERCLTGERRWDEESPPELAGYLCGVIKSLISDERKAFRRDKADLVGEAILEVPDPVRRQGLDAIAGASDDDDDEGRTAICAAIEACAEGDETLQLFRLAVLDGNTKREDIASALGWSPDQASAARIKLQRRLTSRFPQEFAAIMRKRRAS